MSFVKKAISFHEKLEYTGSPLPAGIRIMNPFKENPEALRVTRLFLRKYYSDKRQRRLILGINPGRLGAGLTGVPFTDPKRMIAECGIDYRGEMAHEPSSVFVYDMIRAFGGPEKFYGEYYINSPCPLGFTSVNKLGREVNYNYYDSPQLMAAVKPFIVESISKLVELGVYTDRVFCLGTGRNAHFLRRLNEEYRFFGELIALEHPRYIMQYKSKEKEDYVRKYMEVLRDVDGQQGVF